jgi:hypothetical protein
VTRPGPCVAAICGALCLGTGPPSAAQTAATFDAGGATIRYDGFLASGAMFASPTLRFTSPRTTLAVQGNYVVFESGNEIVQGTAAGAWLTPAAGRFRGELSGSGGLSSYAGFSPSGHVLARARLHWLDPARGAWIGGTLGRSFFDSTSWGTSEIAAGVWAVHAGVGVGIDVVRSAVIDTSYVDVVGSARWNPLMLALEGTLGVRGWSRNGGQGVYGEIAVRAPRNGWLAVLVSGGRYPTDVVRGTLAARYLSVGIRLAARPARRSPPPSLASLLRRQPTAPEPGAADGSPRLEITASADELRTIRVTAPRAARSVELAGDFTDWAPVALAHVGGDRWEATVSIPAGTHRLNVRLDGGPWVVPAGVRLEEDEFGGGVGILAVW